MAHKILSSQYKRLITVAREARRFSHSPYSDFRVGAALLTTDGRIYAGCNVENSSYGLTICAERTAVFKAVSEGKKKFRAIAIVTDKSEITPPCGACRQVLMEFAPNIDCVMSAGGSRFIILKLRELLPHPFAAENLLQSKRKS